MTAEKIAAAKEAFGKLVEEQLKRVEVMKSQGDFLDYKKLDQIIIGVCGGDGIEQQLQVRHREFLNSY